MKENMSKKSTDLHFEILDKLREELFYLLATFNEIGYLAGGTALALQIGHRHSYDFDIFCYQEITNSLINKCRKIFSIKQVILNNSGEFTFLTKKDVKITFLYYPFEFAGSLIKTKNNIYVLSILNIASAKAYTLNRRASYRDYVDIYFIMKNKGFTIKQIINNSQKVYGDLFSAKLFLSQLVYVDDLPKAELESIKYFGKKVPAKEIFDYFHKIVAIYKLGN